MVRSGSRLNSWKTVDSPACWAWTGWLNDDRLAPRARRCPRRAGRRRRGSSSASTCRRRSRRPGRAPGRRAARGRRPRGRVCPTKLFVRPRALSTTSPAGDRLSSRGRSRRTASRRHCGTAHALLSRVRQKLFAGRAEVPRGSLPRVRDQRRLRAAARRAAPDPGPARGGHRAGPLDDRGPDRRAAAARPGGAVRRRRLHRRPTAVAAGAEPAAPGWSPASTSAPRTPPAALADLSGTVLVERRADLDIADGPEHVLGWVEPVIAETARRPAPRPSPSWPRSASGCPGRSSTRPAARSTRRSCPAGTATTCRPTCSGPSTCRCSSTTTSTSWRWASSTPTCPTSTTWSSSRSAPASAPGSSPAASCSAAPRAPPATSATSAWPRAADVTCRCGNHGCLEAVAAVPALATALRAAGRATVERRPRRRRARARRRPARGRRRCGRPAATSARWWRCWST